MANINTDVAAIRKLANKARKNGSFALAKELDKQASEMAARAERASKPAMAVAVRTERKVAKAPVGKAKPARGRKPRVSVQSLAAFKAHLTMARAAVKGTRGKARTLALALVAEREAKLDNIQAGNA